MWKATYRYIISTNTKPLYFHRCDSMVINLQCENKTNHVKLGEVHMALTVSVCTFGMRSVKFPRKSTMRVLISPTTAACCVNCRTTAPSALSDAAAAWGWGGRPRGRPPRGLWRGTGGGAADTEIRAVIKLRKLPSQQKRDLV